MKKAILYTLIATFSISALIGIGIIILDLWDDITSKILFSTITIFGFSIPSLSCSTIYGKNDKRWFSILGLSVCVISALYYLLCIWGIVKLDFDDGFTIKLFIQLLILSISLGHISLLLLIENRDKTVISVRNATVGVSILLNILIIGCIWIEDFTDIFPWQVYAIIAILIVLGTIVSPILNKARSGSKVDDIIDKREILEDKKVIAKNKLNDLLKDNYVTQEEYDLIIKRIEKKEQ